MSELEELLRYIDDETTTPAMMARLRVRIENALSQQAEPVEPVEPAPAQDDEDYMPEGITEAIMHSETMDIPSMAATALREQLTAPAQDEREAFKRALHSQKVFKLSSATIDAAEWAWFARPAQTEQQPFAYADPSDLNRMEKYGQTCMTVWRDKQDCVSEPLFLLAAPIAQTTPQVPERLPVEPYQTVDRSSTNYKAGWNACRKAMLEGQTAPQFTSADESAVRELLAVLNRDGGQHQDSVGLAQAAQDALGEVDRLRQAQTALSSSPETDK